MDDLIEKTKLSSASSSHFLRWVYQCPQCPRSYSNEAGAWQHFFAWHDDGIQIDKVRQWRVQVESPRSNAIPFVNGIRPTSTQASEPKKMRKKRVRIKCAHCSQMVTDFHVKKHARVHVGGKLPCPAPGCGGLFLTRNNVRDHTVQTHPGLSYKYNSKSPVRLYGGLGGVRGKFNYCKVECPLCCEKVPINVLTQHRRGAHPKDGDDHSFKCPDCHGTFISQKRLGVHRVQWHRDSLHYRVFKHKSRRLNAIKIEVPDSNGSTEVVKSELGSLLD